MDIDMRALRDLAQDKEISLDRLFEAIEQALLLAYERTEGATARRPGSSSTARAAT